MLVGVLAAIAALGALLGGGVLLDRYESAVHQATLIDPHARAKAALKPGRPLNLLLIGTDLRPDENQNDPARSDSIIVVHVPPAHDRAYLISIPRDLLVDIPADPATGQPAAYDKINAAFANGDSNGGGLPGGMRLLSQTLTDLSGLRFNAGAIINFGGFQALVSALGGVDMCIDERVVSIHTGAVYQRGCRHLQPWQALDYVRQREGLPGGDYDRERHQQQFLKAVVRQTSGAGLLSDPIKLDRVVRAAGSALTFDGGGASVLDWALALHPIGPDAVTLIRTAGHPVLTREGDWSTYQGEALDPASRALLDAVQEEKVQEWVTAHPDLIATDTQPGG
jgi:LCP family protein required for cell wall assembly